MSKLALWVIVGIVVVVVAVGVFVTQVPKIIQRSGVMDKQMGMMAELPVRLAAGQLELHRLRCGRYPPTLDDIEYLDEWHRGMLMMVRYRTNSEGTAYYIESLGMLGRPVELDLPEGFWHGTGFDEQLKPEPAPSELEAAQPN
jgi:hypothetical protein